MFELIKNLLKLPKITFSICLEPLYSKDITFALIIEYFMFLFSKRRTKFVAYFNDYESCKYFVEKYARNKGLAIIKNKLNNEYSKYQARIVLVKDISYIELLRYSILLSREREDKHDDNKIIEFKSINRKSATA